MKKSFNFQELLHHKSKCHETNPMHPSSSRAIQRDQEHNLKHPGPWCSGSRKYKQNKTKQNKQTNKQPSFIDRSFASNPFQVSPFLFTCGSILFLCWTGPQGALGWPMLFKLPRAASNLPLIPSQNICCVWTRIGQVPNLERYNRWFWLQSVKTELELGLIFGTDSRIGPGNFFKKLFERTRARTRFQVPFVWNWNQNWNRHSSKTFGKKIRT